MSKTAKITITLMIVTMLSKVLGFAREQVLSYFYGIGTYASAYITAINIPTILFAAVGTALATTFIPLYMESDNNGGKEVSNKFVNNVFNSVAIVGVTISILGLIFTEPMVKLFAYKFEGEELRLTVQFSKIMISGVLFMGLSHIMTAYLQSKNNFIIPGLIGFPYNIVIITSIILSSKGNVNILAYGALIAMASQFLFQIPFAFKKGYSYKLCLDVKDEYLKKMVWLLGPIFIGGAVNQINALVDRNIASALGAGIIPALSYSNKLNGFVQGLFITSLGAVIYPQLSRLSLSKDNKKFADTVVSSVNSVILLMIPISVGAIALSNPIVKFVFERGAFDSEATKLTAVALMMYSVGMTSFGLIDILGKIFYSLHNTKTPMIIGSIGVVMNIIMNLIFVKIIGYAGLPLATSLSSIACAILLFINLGKKIGYYGQDKILNTISKSIFASILMGFGSYYGYQILSKYIFGGFIKEAVVLLMSIIIGVIIYAILLIVLKVKEVDVVINFIKNKMSK